MIELWELPEDIRLAVLAHHDVSVQGIDYPLAAIVCLADALATELGKPFAPTTNQNESEEALVERALAEGCAIDESALAVIERAKQCLEITEEALQEIRVAASAVFQS